MVVISILVKDLRTARNTYGSDTAKDVLSVGRSFCNESDEAYLLARNRTRCLVLETSGETVVEVDDDSVWI